MKGVLDDHIRQIDLYSIFHILGGNWPLGVLSSTATNILYMAHAHLPVELGEAYVVE